MVECALFISFKIEIEYNKTSLSVLYNLISLNKLIFNFEL